MARNFYEVLGVPRNADRSEIQRAYRKLARHHHPDVNKDPSAEARFKEISEAYDLLSDPELRQRYDAFGEDFRTHFRPEFLNRVDEIVLFKPLTLAEIEAIVDLLLNDLRTRLLERRITLLVTERARRFIADQGFDPAYGARPLRRFIAREVETRVARALLRGELPDGGVISVDLVNGELTVVSTGGPPEERAAA